MQTSFNFYCRVIKKKAGPVDFLSKQDIGGNWYIYDLLVWKFCLIGFFTSQSTIFQLCRDRSSLVETVLKKD